MTLESIQQEQLIVAMVAGIIGLIISIVLLGKEIYFAFLLSLS
jgi:nicotinamide riboside transporter PnuC